MDFSSNITDFVRLTVENENQKQIIKILREQNLELKSYSERLEKKLEESLKLSDETIALIKDIKGIDFNKTT